ncbi:MAG: HAD family hydrolase [Candidatus Omnitrophica bacterium]|nr:HAD family hydrolase [Candidatus Omnitrophota bacterium]
MRGVKLVIFDLDGTLIDAYAAIIESFNYTMRKLDYPLQSARAIRRAVGWGDALLLKPFVKPKELKAALDIYRSHHEVSLLKYSRLLPGTKPVLRYLKAKKLKIAVASNRPTRFSLILINHLKLKKYFDYVLCADKLKRGKPDPSILKGIMSKFRARPVETVYVGDMAIDAQAGRRGGVRTVIVSGGSSTLAEIRKEKPWRIVRKQADLLKLFKGRLG